LGTVQQSALVPLPALQQQPLNTMLWALHTKQHTHRMHDDILVPRVETHGDVADWPCGSGLDAYGFRRYGLHCTRLPPSPYRSYLRLLLGSE
jgi:hypothetical protein